MDECEEGDSIDAVELVSFYDNVGFILNKKNPCGNAPERVNCEINFYGVHGMQIEENSNEGRATFFLFLSVQKMCSLLRYIAILTSTVENSVHLDEVVVRLEIHL